MKCKFTAARAALACAVATTSLQAAAADGQGSFAISLGWLHMAPQSSASHPLIINDVDGHVANQELSGTGAKVKSLDTASLTFEYFVADNLSAEMFVAVPVKAKIAGTGSLQSYGNIGEGRIFNPTATIKYWFGAPTDAGRAFIGAGAVYPFFDKVKLTNEKFNLDSFGPNSGHILSIDKGLRPAVTLGATYKITESYNVGLTALYAPVEATVRIHTTTGTGSVINSSESVRINPLVTYLFIQKKF